MSTMVVTKDQLRAAHVRYEEALQLKSDKLLALDQWYRSELSSTLQARQRDQDGAFLTTDELVKLMHWKLTRGKFRPRLEQLAQSNADSFVRAQTRKAFAILSESESPEAAKESLIVLNSLKGVGPATSSAILSPFKPHSMAFMSDEALEIAACLVGKPKYTVGEWQWYTEKMRERASEEAWEGGTSQLEQSAWAYAVLKRNAKLTTGEVQHPATKKTKKRSQTNEAPEQTPSKKRRPAKNQR